MDDQLKINALTEAVIGAAIEVHRQLRISAYSATPRFKSHCPIHTLNGYLYCERAICAEERFL